MPRGGRKFTIPKIASARELLEECDENSREYKSISAEVNHSLWNPKCGLQINKIEIVNNDQLVSQFNQKKVEMQKESTLRQQTIYGFKSVENYEQAKLICKTGLLTGFDSKVACLGDPTCGVYLSRCADVLKRFPLKSNKGMVMVVFQIVKGKFLSIAEQQGTNGDLLEPTPDHDGHVSRDYRKMEPKSVKNPSTYSKIFDSSQIYLYEMDNTLDEFYVKRPRHCVPYAVVFYRFIQETPSEPAASEAMSKVPAQRLLVSNVAQLKPRQEHLDNGNLYFNELEKSLTLWAGKLYNKSIILTDVKIICHAKEFSGHLPVCSNDLTVYMKTKVSILEKEFPQPLYTSTPLDSKCPKVLKEGKEFLHCEMWPQNNRSSKFALLKRTLKKRSEVLVIKLPQNYDLFIIPTGTFTKSLGITLEGYPETLHLLFVRKMFDDNKISKGNQAFLKDARLILDSRILELEKLKLTTPIAAPPPVVEVDESVSPFDDKNEWTEYPLFFTLREKAEISTRIQRARHAAEKEMIMAGKQRSKPVFSTPYFTAKPGGFRHQSQASNQQEHPRHTPEAPDFHAPNRHEVGNRVEPKYYRSNSLSVATSQKEPHSHAAITSSLSVRNEAPSDPRLHKFTPYQRPHSYSGGDQQRVHPSIPSAAPHGTLNPSKRLATLEMTRNNSYGPSLHMDYDSVEPHASMHERGYITKVADFPHENERLEKGPGSYNVPGPPVYHRQISRPSHVDTIPRESRFPPHIPANEEFQDRDFRYDERLDGYHGSFDFREQPHVDSVMHVDSVLHVDNGEKHLVRKELTVHESRQTYQDASDMRDARLYRESERFEKHHDSFDTRRPYLKRREDSVLHSDALYSKNSSALDTTEAKQAGNAEKLRDPRLKNNSPDPLHASVEALEGSKAISSDFPDRVSLSSIIASAPPNEACTSSTRRSSEQNVTNRKGLQMTSERGSKEDVNQDKKEEDKPEEKLKLSVREPAKDPRILHRHTSQGVASEMPKKLFEGGELPSRNPFSYKKIDKGAGSRFSTSHFWNQSGVAKPGTANLPPDSEKRCNVESIVTSESPQETGKGEVEKKALTPPPLPPVLRNLLVGPADSKFDFPKANDSNGAQCIVDSSVTAIPPVGVSSAAPVQTPKVSASPFEPSHPLVKRLTQQTMTHAAAVPQGQSVPLPAPPAPSPFMQSFNFTNAAINDPTATVHSNATESDATKDGLASTVVADVVPLPGVSGGAAATGQKIDHANTASAFTLTSNERKRKEGFEHARDCYDPPRRDEAKILEDALGPNGQRKSSGDVIQRGNDPAFDDKVFSKRLKTGNGLSDAVLSPAGIAVDGEADRSVQASVSDSMQNSDHATKASFTKHDGSKDVIGNAPGCKSAAVQGREEGSALDGHLVKQDEEIAGKDVGQGCDQSLEKVPSKEKRNIRTVKVLAGDSNASGNGQDAERTPAATGNMAAQSPNDAQDLRKKINEIREGRSRMQAVIQGLGGTDENRETVAISSQVFLSGHVGESDRSSSDKEMKSLGVFKEGMKRRRSRSSSSDRRRSSPSSGRTKIGRRDRGDRDYSDDYGGARSPERSRNRYSHENGSPGDEKEVRKRNRAQRSPSISRSDSASDSCPSKNKRSRVKTPSTRAESDPKHPPSSKGSEKNASAETASNESVKHQRAAEKPGVKTEGNVQTDIKRGAKDKPRAAPSQSRAASQKRTGSLNWYDTEELMKYDVDKDVDNSALKTSGSQGSEEEVPRMRSDSKEATNRNACSKTKEAKKAIVSEDQLYDEIYSPTSPLDEFDFDQSVTSEEKSARMGLGLSEKPLRGSKSTAHKRHKSFDSEDGCQEKADEASIPDNKADNNHAPSVIMQTLMSSSQNTAKALSKNLFSQTEIPGLLDSGSTGESVLKTISTEKTLPTQAKNCYQHRDISASSTRGPTSSVPQGVPTPIWNDSTSSVNPDGSVVEPIAVVESNMVQKVTSLADVEIKKELEESSVPDTKSGSLSLPWVDTPWMDSFVPRSRGSSLSKNQGRNTKFVNDAKGRILRPETSSVSGADHKKGLASEGKFNRVRHGIEHHRGFDRVGSHSRPFKEIQRGNLGLNRKNIIDDAYSWKLEAKRSQRSQSQDTSREEEILDDEINDLPDNSRSWNSRGSSRELGKRPRFNEKAFRSSVERMSPAGNRMQPKVADRSGRRDKGKFSEEPTEDYIEQKDFAMYNYKSQHLRKYNMEDSNRNFVRGGRHDSRKFQYARKGLEREKGWLGRGTRQQLSDCVTTEDEVDTGKIYDDGRLRVKSTDPHDAKSDGIDYHFYSDKEEDRGSERRGVERNYGDVNNGSLASRYSGRKPYYVESQDESQHVRGWPIRNRDSARDLRELGSYDEDPVYLDERYGYASEERDADDKQDGRDYEERSYDRGYDDDGDYVDNRSEYVERPKAIIDNDKDRRLHGRDIEREREYLEQERQYYEKHQKQHHKDLDAATRASHHTKVRDRTPYGQRGNFKSGKDHYVQREGARSDMLSYERNQRVDSPNRISSRQNDIANPPSLLDIKVTYNPLAVPLNDLAEDLDFVSDAPPQGLSLHRRMEKLYDDFEDYEEKATHLASKPLDVIYRKKKAEQRRKDGLLSRKDNRPFFGEVVGEEGLSAYPINRNFVSSSGDTRRKSKDSRRNQGTSRWRSGHDSPRRIETNNLSKRSKISAATSRWDIKEMRTIKKVKMANALTSAAPVSTPGLALVTDASSSSPVSHSSVKANASVPVEYVYSKAASDEKVASAQASNVTSNKDLANSGSDMDLCSTDFEESEDNGFAAVAAAAAAEKRTLEGTHHAQPSIDRGAVVVVTAGMGSSATCSERSDGIAKEALENGTNSGADKVCPLTGTRRHGRTFTNLDKLDVINCSNGKVFDQTVKDICQSLKDRLLKFGME